MLGQTGGWVSATAPPNLKLVPTLHLPQEMRIACAVAAMERAGGIFPVVSPLAQVLSVSIRHGCSQSQPGTDALSLNQAQVFSVSISRHRCSQSQPGTGALSLNQAQVLSVSASQHRCSQSQPAGTGALSLNQARVLSVSTSWHRCSQSQPAGRLHRGFCICKRAAVSQTMHPLCLTCHALEISFSCSSCGVAAYHLCTQLQRIIWTRRSATSLTPHPCNFVLCVLIMQGYHVSCSKSRSCCSKSLSCYRGDDVAVCVLALIHRCAMEATCSREQDFHFLPWTVTHLSSNTHQTRQLCCRRAILMVS